MAKLPSSQIEVRQVRAAETHTLRGQIMRPGEPRDKLIYPGDDASDTLHVGAYVQGKQVGIASVYHEAPPTLEKLPPGTRPGGLWRLRSIAVVPDMRRQRVATKLLEACLRHAGAHGGTILWCNATEDALKFYQRNGFGWLPTPYDVPGHGTRYFCWRRIDRMPSQP